jgi:hypothetical protein
VSVIALDASRWIQRMVKGSMRLLVYEQAAGLVEMGLRGAQMFVRSNGGLLLISGSDSPAQYITQHS